MADLLLRSGDIEIGLDLLDTPTAGLVCEQLPIASRVQTWGDEVYFQVPVQADLEAEAREVVVAGEIAFWVEGGCVAIGYGPTPISKGNEIRLAARTNVWAVACDDVRQLRTLSVGDTITLEKI